ncbi:MAG: thioredoxin-dependent thiol peroxidase [Chloroflexi bacterium]|nr:thioredoxin-dependent thiol peroxidase [Chloroflexota bacterium]
MLRTNSKAPEFILKNHDGDFVRLSDFLGKPLIIYFYPQDDTPGCTTEACNFRDDYNAFINLGVDILGISPDSVDSHKEFRDKYHLPFTLLSDPDHQIAIAYGVWGMKEKEGRVYEGIYRTTFILDRKGEITKIFEGVDPASHSQEVLNEVKKIV